MAVYLEECTAIKLQVPLDDIPREVLKRVEKDHPEILEVQSGWGNTIPKGTWEAYAEEVPAEDV